MEKAIRDYIASKTAVSPYDVVSELMPTFYPTPAIVLDAAKYFTTVIKRKDFCVEQDKLVKYGILSPLKNGQPKSNNILQLFQQYGLIENVDYNQRNVALVRKNRGNVDSIVYTMTPKTFFLCLTRSKNSCEYAKYYFHVLEIYDYYEEYFTKLYKEDIEFLQDELDGTNEELTSVEIERDTLEAKLDKLMAKMDKQHIDIQNQMSFMQNTLDQIVKKLDERAIPPANDKLIDRFVLMKKGDSTFYVIRSQERTMPKAIKEKLSDGYSKIPGLIESELIPNSIYLWNCIREILVKENKIKCRYNDVVLRNISEEYLVSIIKQVFDSRKLYTNALSNNTSTSTNTSTSN